MRPLFRFPPSFCVLILLASSDASASHQRTPTERSWRRQRKQQQERASAATAAATAAAAASLEVELLASERWSDYAGAAHGAAGSVGTLSPVSPPSYCNEIIPVTPESCRLLIRATTAGAAMVACTLLESCATPNADDAGDGLSCVLGKARLTRLHPCLFSAMTAMHELAIYRNPHLLALPPGLLAPLTDLRALSIYSNGLGTGWQERTARQGTGRHDTQGGQPRCAIASERQPGEQPRQLELEERQLGHTIPTPTPPARIPHDLLRGLTHLTSLRLHANRLSARDLPALRLPSLQALWLHSNHIEALPRGYLQGHLQEEGRLHDESNSTLLLRLNSSLKASIGSSLGSSLESLFLNKNRLRTLDDDTFRGLTRLRFLWL